MALSSDGKINGKIPIFNDILAFIWNKMCRFPKEHIVKACSEFYDGSDVQTARDLFFKVVPEKAGEKRRVKHRGTMDILASLYIEFHAIPTDSELIFVALNMNNIPSIDLSNIDGASLVHKQISMNETLSSILAQNQTIFSELAVIKESLGPKSAVNSGGVSSAQAMKPSGVPVGALNTVHNNDVAGPVGGTDCINVANPQTVDGGTVHASKKLSHRPNSFSSALRSGMSLTPLEHRRGQHRPDNAVPPQQQSNIQDEQGFQTWNRNRR